MAKPPPNNQEQQRRAFEAKLQEVQISSNLSLESWRRRYYLISLNIASIGTLIGLTITYGPLYLFLSILTLVSSGLGIIWVGENYWVLKELKKIKNDVLPGLRELAKDNSIFHTIGKPMTKRELWDESIQGRLPGASIGILLFCMPSAVSWLIALISWILACLEDGFKSVGLALVLIIFNFILFYPLIRGGMAWFNENNEYLK